MNVVVDYGNSSAKVGIFDQQKLIEKHAFSSVDDLKTFLQKSTASNVLVSSVAVPASDIASWATRAATKIALHPSLPLPIKNGYATPESLGMDRLAGVCGAWQQFPNQNCLVIDTGTCVKYDFIDQGGQYRGGAISPGMHMRFEALHTFTARLPLVKPVADIELVGNSTESCIQSGVVNGLTEEINGIISQYHEKFADLKVILCGGDTRFFENKMKASIFAIPELVLSGLNCILIHNVTR